MCSSKSDLDFKNIQYGFKSVYKKPSFKNLHLANKMFDKYFVE